MCRTTKSIHSMWAWQLCALISMRQTKTNYSMRWIKNKSTARPALLPLLLPLPLALPHFIDLPSEVDHMRVKWSLSFPLSPPLSLFTYAISVWCFPLWSQLIWFKIISSFNWIFHLFSLLFSALCRFALFYKQKLMLFLLSLRVGGRGSWSSLIYILCIF